MASSRRVRPRRRDRGQSLVEMAFSLPILLLLVLAVFEFGNLYRTRLTVRHAVAEAARYAVTGNQLADPVTGQPIGRPESIQKIIQQRAMGLPVQPAQVTLTPADGGGPSDVVRVSVDYRYDIVTPAMKAFFPQGHVAFTVAAAMKNEPTFP